MLKKLRDKKLIIQNEIFEGTATLVAWVLLFVAYIPVYCMINLSVKPGLDMYVDFWGWPDEPGWGAFGWAARALASGVANTMFIIIVTCILMLLVSLLSGYTFARLQFPGKEFLYLMVMIFLMIPDVLHFTPRYTMIKDLGLYDTWWALILPWAATGSIWGTMFVRSHIEGLPRELFDAARIDGCSEVQILFRIALPLSRSIMATVVVIKMVDFYNDFTWPLVVIQQTEKQVITVLVRMYSNSVPGYAVACVPLLILFLCTSSLYMEGMTSGAIKG